MIYLFYAVHVLICLFLILVVLLQQGKGADLSVFGGGATMTAFGARGAATLLHKMTVIGFVGFIVTTLAIGILQKQAGGSSVMTEVPAIEETTATQDAAAEDDAALPEEDESGVLPEAEAEESGVLPEAEEFDASAAEGGEGADDGEGTGDGGEGGETEP